MARLTTIKIVKELEDEGIIANTEKKKQKFSYTTDVLLIHEDKKTMKKFDSILSKNERKFNKLKKFIDTNDLYDIDKSNLIRYFAKSIWFLDWKFYAIREVSTGEEIDKRISRLQELKKNLYDLAWSDDTLSLRTVGLVMSSLDSEARDYEAEFDLDFEDWNYENENH